MLCLSIPGVGSWNHNGRQTCQSVRCIPFDQLSVHRYAESRELEFYQQIQNDTNFPKWNDSGQPLQGSLISGLAAVYFLKERELGEGDKDYALSCYLKEYLGTVTPKELCLNTAGVNQAILIARRIVTACNAGIQMRVLRKRNGDILLHHIGEDMMSDAGLKDPSK